MRFSQNDKNSNSLKVMEKDLSVLEKQEKAVEQDWKKKVSDYEALIKERKAEALKVIADLSKLNEEIEQLKVRQKGEGYKLECVTAIKELHDTQQWESKLKRLEGEIELSD